MRIIINKLSENENHYQIVQKYQKVRVFDQKRSLPRSSKSPKFLHYRDPASPLPFSSKSLPLSSKSLTNHCHPWETILADNLPASSSVLLRLLAILQAPLALELHI